VSSPEADRLIAAARFVLRKLISVNRTREFRRPGIFREHGVFERYRPAVPKLIYLFFYAGFHQFIIDVRFCLREEHSLFALKAAPFGLYFGNR